MRPKGRLLLLELMLSILLFTLCAAVCTGIFLYSHSLSQESASLTGAVAAAQEAAESFHSATSAATLAGMLGGVAENGRIVVYYSGDWRPGSGEDAPYVLTAHLQEEAGLEVLWIQVRQREGGSLYELEAVKLAGEGEA